MLLHWFCIKIKNKATFIPFWSNPEEELASCSPTLVKKADSLLYSCTSNNGATQLPTQVIDNLVSWLGHFLLRTLQWLPINCKQDKVQVYQGMLTFLEEDLDMFSVLCHTHGLTLSVPLACSLHTVHVCAHTPCCFLSLWLVPFLEHSLSSFAWLNLCSSFKIHFFWKLSLTPVFLQWNNIQYLDSSF